MGVKPALGSTTLIDKNLCGGMWMFVLRLGISAEDHKQQN